MKISRIDIRNFRKLRQPVTLNGLDGGITVIAGDNEDGKSTIVKAVQAAFFDRHSLMGEKLDDMQPYGAAGAAPKVDVAFTFEGKPCKLAKSFRPQASATLDAGGKSLENDAVEERLREMLRFTPPGKGAAKADNRGMWSLFWVEQGTAFDPLQLNDDARKTLDETLQSQVGKVLGGKRGTKLLAAVEERHGKHFTAQGRERGQAKTLRDQAETLAGKISAARAELKRFEDQSESLARIEARIAARTRANDEAKYADAVKIARVKLTEIETLRRRVEKAAYDLKNARNVADNAKLRWDQRHEKAKAVAAMRHQIAEAETIAEAARNEFVATEKRHNDAVALENQAEAELKTAERTVTGARAAVERGRLATRLSETKAKLTRAEAAAAAMTGAKAEASAVGIDDETWKRLDSAARRAEKARLQFEGAAAAIVFQPEKTQRVRRDGSPVPAGTLIVLTGTALFALDGFGAVEVRPGGGEDVAELRKAHEKAVQTLAKELAKINATDLDDAARRHARWQELTRIAADQGAKLDGIAPDGIELLRAAVAQDEARLVAIGGETGDPDMLDAALAEAETAYERRQSAVAAARKNRGKVEDALREAGNARVKAETSLGERRGAEDRAVREIEADRTLADDATLDRILVETGREADAAAARLDTEHAALNRADPEAAYLALENAESALNRIKEDARKDEDARIGLQSELRALGAQGLGEQVMQFEGEQSRLSAALAAAEREAKAIRLLRDTLNAKQKEARENFTGPVRERIRPYLKLLFPETEIGIDDESFAIAHLHRAGEPEKFEALSLGTREQIAVLVRLAFAEYIADHGEPPVVILDDALVNADPGRMQRMLLALRKASQKVQIIVLTCNEADYAPLGAPVIRLAESQGGAGAA